MRCTVFAVIGLAAVLSSGCKCSPDQPVPSDTKQEAKAKKKKPSAKRDRDSAPEGGLAHHVDHGGKSVEYRVHLPADVSTKKKHPVIVFLLDRGQRLKGFPDRYNVIHGARKLNYLLAVAEAPAGRRGHWQHGLCKANDAASASASAAPAPSSAAPGSTPPAGVTATSASEGLSDVPYVNALIADLSKQYNVDSSAITIVGIGEGAAMAHQAAAAIPKISSVALFSPKARCAKPAGLTQAEQGRSVMIVSRSSLGNGTTDAGAGAPHLARLAFEAWSASAQCTAESATTKSRKGATTTKQTCAGGRIVQFVEEPQARKGWPVRTAGVYTMRAIHNFLAHQ